MNGAIPNLPSPTMPTFSVPQANGQAGEVYTNGMPHYPRKYLIYVILLLPHSFLISCFRCSKECICHELSMLLWLVVSKTLRCLYLGIYFLIHYSMSNFQRSKSIFLSLFKILNESINNSKVKY